jgi:hypothetical protein
MLKTVVYIVTTLLRSVNKNTNWLKNSFSQHCGSLLIVNALRNLIWNCLATYVFTDWVSLRCNHSVSAAIQAVFPYVETAVVSSGMLLPLLASTAFSNVKRIIVGIPDEVIFIVFKKYHGLDTLVRRAFWRSIWTLLCGRMWLMTRSGLQLNVDSRWTNEPVSLFKISVIVNARIIRIYLLPLFFYWCKVALLQGWTRFPQSVPGNFRCYMIAGRRKLINV